MLLYQCSCCAFVLLYPSVIPTPNAAEESGTFRSSCHSDAEGGGICHAAVLRASEDLNHRSAGHARASTGEDARRSI